MGDNGKVHRRGLSNVPVVRFAGDSDNRHLGKWQDTAGHVERRQVLVVARGEALRRSYGEAVGIDGEEDDANGATRDTGHHVAFLKHQRLLADEVPRRGWEQVVGNGELIVGDADAWVIGEFAAIPSEVDVPGPGRVAGLRDGKVEKAIADRIDGDV